MPIEGIVASAQGERRVSGVIDLLLETDEGVVIVDHKTFPGRSEGAWRKKCREFVAQVAAYGRMVEDAGLGAPRSTWVHLPVGGGVVEITLGDRRAT
jgi:hypothetical protein